MSEEQGKSVHDIDYPGILAEVQNLPMVARVRFLREELPYIWRDACVAETARETNICRAGLRCARKLAN
jgi:hypothetical protein